MTTTRFRLPDGRLVSHEIAVELSDEFLPPYTLHRFTPEDLALRGITVEELPPDPVVPPTTDQLKAHAAALRYGFEVGGCDWGTYRVATDRESQGKLIAEFVAMSAGLRTDPSVWKFANGFAVLSNVSMGEVVLAARTHIADAFAREAACVVAINEGTVTTYEQVAEAFV